MKSHVDLYSVRLVQILPIERFLAGTIVIIVYLYHSLVIVRNSPTPPVDCDFCVVAIVIYRYSSNICRALRIIYDFYIAPQIPKNITHLVNIIS